MIKPFHLFGLLLLATVACDSKSPRHAPIQGPSASTARAVSSREPMPEGWKPSPHLDLKEPKVPKNVDGKDVSDLSPKLLISLARGATDRKDFKNATIYSYWASKKIPGELYDLACNSALSGDKEGAFYWVQQAGIQTGVDVDWAEKDADLLTLRADTRWGDFKRWLLYCEEYHQKFAKPVTTLILPKKYDVKKDNPLNVIVWLHGMGSKPDEFVDPNDPDCDAQAFADELNIAFVGVSGTRIKSKKNFVWAENVAQDFERVKAALDEVKAKVQIKEGGVINFGFSQGAQVGLELAAQHPEVFAGAIVLSPGSNRESIDQIDAMNPLLKKRGFVFGCGEREALGNLLQCDNGFQWTKKAGAQTQKNLYPGQRAHAFPADFEEKFPEWIQFILKANTAK